MRAFGIDVSSVQGQVNWKTVAKQSISFAYVKGTSGIGHDLDIYFARNMQGAKDAGIPRSLYHWWVWSRDPNEQAANVEWAANLANGVDFPVALDFESPDPNKWQEKGCDPVKLLENLLNTADCVTKRLDRAPVVYTYLWFMSSLLAPFRKVPQDLLSRLKEYELWIAAGQRYNQAWTPNDGDFPTCPPPWDTLGWTLWQYSGNKGLQLPGIIGDVDRNCFNGTIEDFKIWAAGGVTREMPEVYRHAAIDEISRK